MDKTFNHDPLIVELRKRYPKKGPNPHSGESLDHWAERFLEYVRKKNDPKEDGK